MNRKEALKSLADGYTIVSYFGYELRLTKHGIESLAPEGEQDSFLPFPDGNEYTHTGTPGNPHDVGTFEWAEYEFNQGHELVSPSGNICCSAYSGAWNELPMYPRDFKEARWENRGAFVASLKDAKDCTNGWIRASEEGECQKPDCCQSEPCKVLCPELAESDDDIPF